MTNVMHTYFCGLAINGCGFAVRLCCGFEVRNLVFLKSTTNVMMILPIIVVHI